MLSTRAIENSADASHYYSQKDNYYTAEQGFTQSVWWGKGAQKLHLDGPVQPETFTTLLAGRLPDGSQLGKVDGNVINHRPGWDLTFSPAKSFSILALIGKDKRLIDAHIQAVNVALQYIEHAFAESRLRSPDGMVYQKTGNLVAALFLHDISRELDPQLHTHAVVLNMTERMDFKWRSLASSMDKLGEKAAGVVHGFYEQILQYKKFLGKIYQMELVHIAKELGYETYINPKTGRVELEGVSLDVIEHFSKRRDQIETFLNENNLSGGKAASFATLSTRKAKQEIDRDKLWNTWVEEAKTLGFDANAAIEKSYQHLTQKDREISIEIKSNEIEAIKNATKSLSVFQPTFSLHDLLMESVLMTDYENYTLRGLTAAIQKEIQNGDLIEIMDNQGKTILMSKETKAHETSLKESLTDNKKSEPTLNSDLVENYLVSEEIDVNLKDKFITLFNDERIVLLEGQNQKEHFLKTTIKIAKAHDLKISFVNPTLISSKLFGKEYNSSASIWKKIKDLFVSNTNDSLSISQFISQHTDKSTDASSNPDIVIVNHAQLLSTEQKSQLALWNRKNNKKLVLVTENDKLLAQKVSTNMEFIKSQGIPTITLTTHHDTKLDVQANRNRLSEVLNQSIEVKETDVILKAMADLYARLNEKKRSASWLVAQNKQKAEQMNMFTHEALNDAKKLGKSVMCDVLIPKFIPEGRAVFSSTYKKNQMLRFNEDYKRLNIHKGEYLKIISSHKKENCIMLESHDGKIIKWQPEKLASHKVELFEVHLREFQIGERIVFHRSIRDKTIVKGEYFTILNVSKNKLKLLDQANKKITINLNEPNQKHFDYGYAGTLHAMAPFKAEYIIAEMPAKAYASNQRTLTQIIDQAEHTIIYTDSHKDLAGEIFKKTGDKISVEEILNRSEILRNNLHSLYDLIEARLKKEGKNQNISKRAVEALEYAIQHLSERQAAFTHKDLLTVAINHALGEINFAELTRASLQIEKEGMLIKSKRDTGTLWTTIDAIQMEREIIELSNRDKGKLDPIADDATIEAYAKKNTLNKEQTAAVFHLLQSTDRVMALQGRAGAGKTTMFATYKEIIDAKALMETKGYEILGLAPTNVAAKQLMSKGIKATTLDSFIVNLDREPSLNPGGALKARENLILILDEASMASNRKMLAALKTTHALKARLILTGDTKQNPAVEAGKPQTLVEECVQVVELKENRRQNDPVLKKAVSEMYDNDYKKAFETLSACIIEVADKNIQSKENQRKDRITTLVDHYFALRKSKHTDAALMVLGNDDRKLINEAVHSRKKNLGELTGQAKDFDVLLNKNMTFIERSTLKNLEIGQFIRFSTYESKYIKPGDYLEIIAIDKNRVLTLKNHQGKEIFWEMPAFDAKRLTNFEIFFKEKRELMEGDAIRWLRTDKKEDILASEKAVVTKISKDNVTVELASNKRLTFSAKNPKYQHWDYAYAATSYNLQGQDVSIGVGHMESHRQYLANQKSFLVLVTRAKDQLLIYTDDKKRLLEKIIANPGDKLSSLEVIGEFPTTKKEPKDNKKPPHYPKQNDNIKRQFGQSDMAIIKDRLQSQVEMIAADLLGKPTMKTGDTLRFGRKGSLAVSIQGDKAGSFYDFEKAVGGHIFKFIEVYGRMQKKDAIQYAAKLAGFGANLPSESSVSSAPSQTNTNPKLPKKNKNKSGYAQLLVRQSQPIDGTIAQTYLEIYRGIKMEKYPEDIRFHPGIYSKINQKTLPAMLVLARNKSGTVEAVQATYLDKGTGKKLDKKSIKVVKQTFGNLKGATVNIGAGKDKTLITEGVENGLSLAETLPEAKVKITLGKSNFINLDAKDLSKEVIFCLDNDGKKLQSDMLILEAATRLKPHKNISFMVPNRLNSIKQDFNDIHLKLGKEAIREEYKNAESFDEFYGIKRPHSHLDVDEKSLVQLLRKTDDIHKTEVISDADIAKFLRNEQNQITPNVEKYTASPDSKNRDLSSKPIDKKLHEISNIDKEI